ncbi:MAG: glycosyltransferase family 2 protein [Oscillospiraceae bacterium]|jgi:glycosyltransferase involved in cell wall biosynthesis|nr:glycosyltransferase family 2 protein [Oscillospiraceae bacterium]
MKNQSKTKSAKSIRLSQCMIVKNEEANIEHALAWAKDIAYEQIVVDTGSTDRTVEIAKKMGAKVYHFNWINDFSAAKNYAVDHATGDWIAFFDADEYLLPGDDLKLLANIKRIEADPDLNEKIIAFSCKWINVDENGKPMSNGSNIRVFRNIPSLRFFGRIHERFHNDPNRVTRMEDFTFIHTGYSNTAIKEKNKQKRNVEILRNELLESPDDIDVKGYLADSLKLSDNEDDIIETDKLFAEVLKSNDVNFKLKIKAYIYFLNKYINNLDKLEDCEELCKKALVEFPNSLDFEYFQASILNKKGDYTKAWELLKNCEERLLTKTNTGADFYVTADPTMLSGQLLLAAQGLGDVANIIKYATVILTMDKTRHEILSPLIYTLKNYGASDDDIFGILMSVYDFSDPNELITIARAAKDSGAITLAQKTIEMYNTNS